MISESDSENDPTDARLLARLAHVGPELLSPIRQRSQKTQVYLALVRARDVAVQSRTKIINAVRGIVKSTGVRLSFPSNRREAEERRKSKLTAESRGNDGSVESLENQRQVSTLPTALGNRSAIPTFPPLLLLSFI
jgi:transposase